MASLVLMGFAWIAASLPLSAQNANRGLVHTTHTVGSQANLNFGTFIAGAGGGTLTLDSSGSRTSTGTVVPMLTAPAPAAGFIVINLNGTLTNGYPGYNGRWVADYYLFIGTDQCATPSANANDPGFFGYPVRTPNAYTIPNLTLNRVGGGASMVVNFTPQSVSTPPGYQTTNIAASSTANPFVSQPQYIVGTVNVAANQMTGTYTRNIIIRYNDGNGANTTTVTVTATVMAPLTLVKNTDMDFGTLVAGAGTATLSPTGVLTTTPAVIPLAGVPTAARFSAQGAQGNNYLFSLPSSVTLSNGSGGTVVVDTFTADRPLTGTFPAAGSQPVVFNVGGTLHTTGTEPDGLYQASLMAGGSTFTANIVYN